MCFWCSSPLHRGGRRPPCRQLAGQLDLGAERAGQGARPEQGRRSAHGGGGERRLRLASAGGGRGRGRPSVEPEPRRVSGPRALRSLWAALRSLARGLHMRGLVGGFHLRSSPFVRPPHRTRGDRKQLGGEAAAPAQAVPVLAARAGVEQGGAALMLI